MKANTNEQGITACLHLWRGERRTEDMCSTYLMPTVCLSILLLSVTVVWEMLKGDGSGCRARLAALQGTWRETCWAPSQKGSHPQWWGPFLLKLNNRMKCAFSARPPDVPFSRDEGLCECFRVCTWLCLGSCVFSTVIILCLCCEWELYQVYCFYQLAVFTNGSLITEFIWLVQNNADNKVSFHLPFQRIKWAQSVSDEAHVAEPVFCLICLDVLMPTNTEPERLDKKEQRILEQLTT